jgi:hypothetical protein
MTETSERQHIRLNPPGENIFLTNRKLRYLPLILGCIHFCVMVIFLLIFIYTPDPEINVWQLGFQFLLSIIFLTQGVYTLRQDRQLFVSFEAKRVRFRDHPKKKEVSLPRADIRQVEIDLFHADFHLQNGHSYHLSWDNADYDQIQVLKNNLRELQADIQA